MYFYVVTRGLDVLRIFLGVLREVTVLDVPPALQIQQSGPETRQSIPVSR
jgi:hypothetical protein